MYVLSIYEWKSELVLAGGRVHWLSFQGEPSSGVFLRGRSENPGVATSGGSLVQHPHHVLLDSPHSVQLAQSSVPS